MATMDGWGMEKEADRLQGRLPGGGGGGGAPKPAAPRLSAPARFGANLRAGAESLANTTRNVAGATRSTAAAVGTAAAEPVSQFTRGLTGVTPPATPRSADPASRFAQPVTTGAAPRAAAPTPGLNMNNPTAPRAPGSSPDGVTKSIGADGVVTYTGTPGATPSQNLGTFTGQQPQLRRATPAGAENFGAPFDAVAAVQPAVAGQQRVANLVRGQVAAGLKPGSTQDELMRRMQHSQDSYFNKGSPSARAANAAAYQGQMGALTQASSVFQRDANAALGAGAGGAIRQGLDAQAIEGQARLKRMGVEGDIALEQVRQDAPGTVVGDDRVLRFRRGTQATPITDENGKPIRAPQAASAGALTPQDLLKAYTAEREAIVGSLGSAEEKAAAMAQLDSNPLYAPLTGQGAAPSAPPAAAIELLRANPSEAAKFDAIFGEGAAAQYLGN